VIPDLVATSLLELFPRLLSSLDAGAGGPFAAAVILRDKVIGAGTNTVLRDLDVTRHAEVNALADAGRATGQVHLEGALLVSSHAPCLMCYHAAKWAMIGHVYYVFGYEETERIFGFRGDARMLSDLGITAATLERDPALALHQVREPRVDALYREELPRLWASSYRARCGRYDV
jgi:guanine deaminase